MTDKELMQQALDALTIFREWEMGQDYNSNRETVLARAFKAEEAIRTALAQGEQEPVAWISAEETWLVPKLVISDTPKDGYKPVYTTPPQRPWKSLTDAEIKSTASLGIYEKPLIDFARAVEAKLKEKNT